MNNHEAIHADFLKWASAQPADRINLVFGSPPYEDARTYDMKQSRRGEEWVAWMVEVVQQSLRICSGLVAFVIEGRTRKFRWSATPVLLMADLHRKGIHLRKPPAFHRVGIPGSGGPDWLRNDYEFIVCATNGGKLPWSDNTVMGAKCKHAVGGEMSYRNSDGVRKNQRHRTNTGKLHTKREADGTMRIQKYIPPKLANPGNVIQQDLTLTELIDILICYEQTTSSTTSEVLRDLRQADHALRLQQWFYGVCLRIEAATFLQPQMFCGSQTSSRAAEMPDVQETDTTAKGRIDSHSCGKDVLLSAVQRDSGETTERSEAGRITTQGQEASAAEKSSDGLRELPADEATGNPPPRRRRDEQHPKQPARVVSVVPPKRTQADQMHSPGMWQSVLRSGFLQQALPEIQKAWRSIDARFRAEQATESGNLIAGTVGGGHMGSPLAHLSEAPFPEWLATFFVRSFCPPGGVVLDPFAGSGTVAAVCEQHGRDSMSVDIRESQIKLVHRRIAEATQQPMLF